MDFSFFSAEALEASNPASRIPSKNREGMKEGYALWQPEVNLTF